MPVAISLGLLGRAFGQGRLKHTEGHAIWAASCQCTARPGREKNGVGCGSKLNHEGTAGFGPCCHLFWVPIFDPQPVLGPGTSTCRGSLSRRGPLGLCAWPGPQHDSFKWLASLVGFPLTKKKTRNEAPSLGSTMAGTEMLGRLKWSTRLEISVLLEQAGFSKARHASPRHPDVHLTVRHDAFSGKLCCCARQDRGKGVVYARKQRV